MASNYSRQGTQTPVLFTVVKTVKRLPKDVPMCHLLLKMNSLTPNWTSFWSYCYLYFHNPIGHTPMRIQTYIYNNMIDTIRASQFHEDGVKFKTASAY